MSRLASDPRMSPAYYPGEDWRRADGVAERERGSGGGGSGWLITGLIVLGLGALAWYYLGPDLRRYMKIRSM